MKRLRGNPHRSGSPSAIPVRPWTTWEHGRRGLAPNTYRIVFPEEDDHRLRVRQPFIFPSLPATPNSCGPNWQIELGGETYHKVMQRVLNLLCTTSSLEEKRAAN